MPSDSTTLVGTGGLSRVVPGQSDSVVRDGAVSRAIIPSSFVAKIDRKSLATPVELRIGKGGWIIQAKANIRASSPANVDVQLLLMADAETTLSDAAKASVANLGYATVVATLGFQVSATALIKLALAEQGGGALIDEVVLTAIRQDDVTLFTM